VKLYVASCIRESLVDGELRHGPGADCAHLRLLDPARVAAASSIRVVEPELRVAAAQPTGGIAMVGRCKVDSINTCVENACGVGT